VEDTRQESSACRQERAYNEQVTDRKVNDMELKILQSFPTSVTFHTLVKWCEEHHGEGGASKWGVEQAVGFVRGCDIYSLWVKKIEAHFLFSAFVNSKKSQAKRYATQLAARRDLPWNEWPCHCTCIHQPNASIRHCTHILSVLILMDAVVRQLEAPWNKDDNRHLLPSAALVHGAPKGKHHYVHDAFVTRCSYKSAKELLRICMMFPAEQSAIPQYMVPSGKGDGSRRTTSSTTLAQIALRDWSWLGDICLCRGSLSWRQGSANGSSSMIYQDVALHGTESMHTLYDIALWGQGINIANFFSGMRSFPPHTAPLSVILYPRDTATNSESREEDNHLTGLQRSLDQYNLHGIIIVPSSRGQSAREMMIVSIQSKLLLGFPGEVLQAASSTEEPAASSFDGSTTTTSSSITTSSSSNASQ
jgi:hypothetical protein